MNTRYLLAIVCLFLITVLIGCGPNEEELSDQISASVLETVEAIPTATAYPTLTPLPTATTYPTLTPLPTLTPVTAELENLYCNFGFCIKYPQDSVIVFPSYAGEFIQEIAGELNTAEEGGYRWISDSVWIYLNWYELSGSPKEHVEFAIDDPNYTDVGEVREATINGIEVAYAPYNADVSTVPHRLFSVWRCGNRIFSYSIRSNEDVDLMPFLENGVTDFACSDASG